MYEQQPISCEIVGGVEANKIVIMAHGYGIETSCIRRKEIRLVTDKGKNIGCKTVFEIFGWINEKNFEKVQVRFEEALQKQWPNRGFEIKLISYDKPFKDKNW